MRLAYRSLAIHTFFLALWLGVFALFLFNRNFFTSIFAYLSLRAIGELITERFADDLIVICVLLNK